MNKRTLQQLIHKSNPVLCLENGRCSGPGNDDHDHWWDEDDWDNEDVEEALHERREFRDERLDDVLAARNQRLETRQGMAAQRQLAA